MYQFKSYYGFVIKDPNYQYINMRDLLDEFSHPFKANLPNISCNLIFEALISITRNKTRVSIWSTFNPFEKYTYFFSITPYQLHSELSLKPVKKQVNRQTNLNIK